MTYTFDNLLQIGVCAEIVDPLRLLTHNESEPYLDYVRRIAESDNIIAIAVKRNDLYHNLERGHKTDYDRLVAKYEDALEKFDNLKKQS